MYGPRLPEATEILKRGEPAAVEADGMILAVYGGHKKHVKLVVTPSTKQAFESQLASYETGKGSIKLPYDQPLPVQLLRDILAYRANEYRERGVKWM